LYTTQQRTVLIIFPLILWTVITAQMLPTGGRRAGTLLWPPYEIGQAIIFLSWFLSFFFFYLSFFSSTNLSGRRLDVYHTSTHGVALAPSGNLECRSETCCTRLAGNTGCKKSPFWHHHTTLSGYIFGTKAYIDKRKKNLLNSNTSSTCPANMVNFGVLAAEICWRVWGTPANFNAFRVLAALLHGTLVVGVSQTLQHWTEGAPYIWQGGHHAGHWPTF